MRVLLLFVSALMLTSCGGNDGPPLEMSNATVFAPLPGTHIGVAYGTIRNNTQSDIIIGSIRSPQFESASLHETQYVDGISKMVGVASLRIPARSTVELEEGGLHVMLMRPHESMAMNQPVNLEFEFDADGLLIVATVLRSRLGHESHD